MNLVWKAMTLFGITIGYDNKDEDDKYIIKHIIYNIKQKKVTLDDLKVLQKLKKDYREIFFKDVKDMVSDNELHELNKKVMEHARDLVAPEDNIFYLRRPSEDAIFRDLLYLEAKKNNFTVKRDENENLIINFPKSLLNLYKPLINNFYSKNFKNDKLKEKTYELYNKHKKTVEDLGDEREEILENYYIKQSLAQSIMHLFISKNILKEFVPDNKLQEFIKKLNNIEGAYINNLASSNILDLVIYSSSNNEIESIKILGENVSEG